MVANGPELPEGVDKDAETEDRRQSPPMVGQLEKDRKIRREIANSNERRRMQSINAGFQTLRNLLPSSSRSCSSHSAQDSEKLSKATILQQAANYIKQLEDEKRQVLDQCEELQRASRGGATTAARTAPPPAPLPHPAATSVHHQQLPSRLLPPPAEQQAAAQQQQQPAAGLKRKKRDTESSDEGIALAYTTNLSDEAMSPQPLPPPPPSSMVEEMRRELQELRAVLEAERQRYGTLERRCTMLQERLQQALLQAAATTTTTPAAAVAVVGESTQPQRDRTPTAVRAMTRDDRCPAVSRCYPATAEEADPVRSQESLSKRNLQMIAEAISHLERNGNLAKYCSPSPTSRGSSTSECGDAVSGSRANKRRGGSSQTMQLHSAVSEPTSVTTVAPSRGGDPSSGFAVVGQQHLRLLQQQQQQQGLFYRPTFMANVPTIVEHMATSGRR